MREFAESIGADTAAAEAWAARDVDDPQRIPEPPPVQGETLFGRRGIIVLDGDLRPECSIHGGKPIERKGRARAVCSTCHASAWVGLRPIGDPSRSRIV